MSEQPENERPPTVKALMDGMEAMAKVFNEWAEQLRPAFERMSKVRIPNPLLDWPHENDDTAAARTAARKYGG